MEEAPAPAATAAAVPATASSVLPAVAAYVAAVLMQGAALKAMTDGPDFQWRGPEIGSVWEVGLSLGAVSLTAWFMRTTLLEVASDFRRRRRNMRALLRATALIGAVAAGITALWGLAVAGLRLRGVALILVPLPVLWLLRSVAEGWAVAKLYGKPLPLTAAMAVAFGGVSLVVAFVAVCSVNSEYVRVVKAFRG